MLRSTHFVFRYVHGRISARLLMLFLLVALTSIEFAPFLSSPASASAQSHTVQITGDVCRQSFYSSDGNPYAECPGPYPVGGNCVWWAWEQWHLLGYDLPVNWGNAADWAMDAYRSGLIVGTTPKVGAIAVFPRADGVWAYGPDGHVAFVTSVSSDNNTFNVTYQNYGDPHFMYTGNGYNTNEINQAQYQDGQLRFIYFPGAISPTLFATLPGLSTITDPVAAVQQGNSLLHSDPQLVLGEQNVTGAQPGEDATTKNHIALGVSSASSDQEFDADFTGSGTSDLLLYNRQAGDIKILNLHPSNAGQVPLKDKVPPSVAAIAAQKSATSNPQLVTLGDTVTPAGHWGSSLEIHIGKFSGGRASDILLYDTTTGGMQFLRLGSDLTIEKHVVLPNIGPGWEISVGQFNGKSSGLFLYKRYAEPEVTTPTSPAPVTGPIVPVPTLVPTPVTIPTPTPTAKATPKPTATPKATATPKPTPKPTVTPTPKPTVTPTPTPKPTATPTPEPTVTPTPTSTVVSTPTPAVVPTPTPAVVPTATPAVVPTPTPTATPAATTTPTVTPTPETSAVKQVDFSVSGQTTPTETPGDSGQSANGDSSTRTANVMLMDFDQNFNIVHRQVYYLWHADWEVYVGRFAGKNQDGIFLYDRTMGEARVIDFNKDMQINTYHEMHNLTGNWMVYSGDFAGLGNAQLMLYDPIAGAMQLMAFDQHLNIIHDKLFSNIGKNEVAYIGHFGQTTPGIMLYDPQAAQSTFMSVDHALAIDHEYLVKSWSQSSQILVGDFADRDACGSSCASDSILVLNRKTGLMEQYVFTFGHVSKVYDNRVQGFMREGVSVVQHVSLVDTSTFSMVSSLSTPIRNEELY